MKDIIRDSVIGQLLNGLSGGVILPYADQRKDFVVPERYRTNLLSRITSHATIIGDTTPPDLKNSEKNLPSPTETAISSSAASIRTVVHESSFSAKTTATDDAAQCRLRPGIAVPASPEDGNPVCEKLRDELADIQLHPELQKEKNLDLVDWYGPDDPDNPRYVPNGFFIDGGDKLTQSLAGTGRYLNDLSWHFQFHSSLSRVSAS
jgi:DHA1 family multidrug resistance protein-like MFS transporter